MYRENSNTSQEVKKQFSLDTNEQTLNRDNADGHSQRGNRKTKLASRIQRQAEEQKQREAPSVNPAAPSPTTPPPPRPSGNNIHVYSNSYITT